MKKLDREEHLEEIFEAIRELAKQDLRVGQIFEIIRGPQSDLFNDENDKLLRKLNTLKGATQ